MPRYYHALDTTHANSVGLIIVETLNDLGYSAEEAIPGLIQAVVLQANGDDALLDEAANLLSDGGV